MNKPTYTVITGASEGFGKALALECAARGMNLILVALPDSRLSQLADFMRKNYQTKILFFEHDLSSSQECATFCEKLNSSGIAVNMLINNAGIGGTHYFDERGLLFYHRQISLNITAPTILCHLLLQNLSENAPSHILNVSSLASFFSLPRKQVYGGTKSYLVSFSKSLRRELKPKKINVSAVCPGGMYTTPAQILQARLGSWISRMSMMDPARVARITMDQLFQNKEIIIPGRLNRFFLLLDRLIPKRFSDLIAEKQMKRQQIAYSPFQAPVVSTGIKQTG